MNTTEFDGKQYTITKEGEKLVLTPVQEKQEGLWSPAPDADYWNVRSFRTAYDSPAGIPEKVSRVNSVQDCTDSSIAFGNCFPTKQIAEKASDLMRRANIFISAALQADPDAGEWSENRRYVVRCDGVMRADCWGSSITSPFPAHVHTKEQAEEMVRILTAEGWK